MSRLGNALVRDGVSIIDSYRADHGDALPDLSFVVAELKRRSAHSRKKDTQLRQGASDALRKARDERPRAPGASASKRRRWSSANDDVCDEGDEQAMLVEFKDHNLLNQQRAAARAASPAAEADAPKRKSRSRKAKGGGAARRQRRADRGGMRCPQASSSCAATTTRCPGSSHPC